MFAFLRRHQSGKLYRRDTKTTHKPHLEELEARVVLSGFVDGFEGSTLDPFWTASVNSGSTPFLSSAVAHGGSQSVEFQTNNSGPGNKDVQLSHSFGSATFGKVSVWMYDTGVDVASSNSMLLHLGSLDYPGLFYGIGVPDYDLGSGNDGSTYNVSVGTQGVITSIDRTQAWHQFAMDVTPTSQTFSIDGTVVYSAGGSAGFDSVTLKMFAPSWRPAWTTHFDDFEFTPYGTDITPTKLDWDTAQGGVDFGYKVSGAALTQDTTAQLYWASGTTTDTILEPAATPITIPMTTPLDQEQTVHLAPSDFPGGPAPDAKYLLAVVDPDNKIDEGAVGEANNVSHLETPSVTLTPIPISATEGNEFTGLVATFTEGSGGGIGVAAASTALAAAVPNSSTINYMATIDWGDGTSSAGTVTPNSTDGFDVTGVEPTTLKGHVYAEETARDQPYTFKVIIQEPAYGMVFTNQAASTATVNDAPLTLTWFEGKTDPWVIHFISATPGVDFPNGELGPAESNTCLLASFEDGNPDATEEDFTATIDWNDGTTNTAATVNANANGGFDVTIGQGEGHIYDPSLSGNMFYLTVTITDHGADPIQADKIPVIVGYPQTEPVPTYQTISDLLSTEAESRQTLVKAVDAYNKAFEQELKALGYKNEDIKKLGLDKKLTATDVLQAIAYYESGWNPRRLSAPDCQHGKGIMQLDDRALRSYFPDLFNSTRIWNARLNIQAGAQHLVDLLNEAGGDLRAAVNAYKGNTSAYADTILGSFVSGVFTPGYSYTKPWITAFGLGSAALNSRGGGAVQSLTSHQAVSSSSVQAGALSVAQSLNTTASLTPIIPLDQVSGLLNQPVPSSLLPPSLLILFTSEVPRSNTMRDPALPILSEDPALPILSKPRFFARDMASSNSATAGPGSSFSLPAVVAPNPDRNIILLVSGDGVPGEEKGGGACKS